MRGSNTSVKEKVGLSAGGLHTGELIGGEMRVRIYELGKRIKS